ncbi:MAG: lipopolysaccharide kinase InaA family protein [Planctomycetes bacterium]|nr:lipopolysaccharide kinase InaA family protein [Planctomycetota bacterium]
MTAIFESLAEYSEILATRGISTFDSLLRFDEGVVVNRNSRRSVLRVETLVPGKKFYLKRYGKPQWKDLPGHYLTLGRFSGYAPVEKLMVESFRSFGFITPRIVAFGEDRGKSLLLLEGLEPRVSLDDYIARYSPDEPTLTEIARQLANLVAGVHSRGACYPDLKIQHIFIDPDDPRGKIACIDHHRSRLYSSPKRRIKDLSALLKSAPRVPLKTKLTFLRTYVSRRLPYSRGIELRKLADQPALAKMILRG